MELRHLTSFVALAEELHFGRAAARLHLTQPSLSQQLQRLEKDVGARLVERTSHAVRLTPAGRAFEVEARAVLDRTGRAIRVAREAADGRAGTVRVGYNFPAGQHVLPGALARIQDTHPGVAVELSERRTGPQLASLAGGDLDVALVYGRPVTADFRWRHLMRLPMVAVVGPGHPWAGLDAVSFAELAEQRCVLFDRAQSPAMYDAITTAAERAGIRLDVAHTTDDSGATAILVSVRPLVGFASATRGSTATDGLHAVRLHDPTPAVDLCAVWRPEADPARDAFLEHLGEPVLV